MKCRHCQTDLSFTLIDLGSAPPSNAYLNQQALKAPEKYYPLKVLVCTTCWLTQTEDYTNADELFSSEYAYFSSYSTSWLKHAEQYVSDIINRFDLDHNSHIIEIAANDGYLLQYFKTRGIPCLGVEPTKSTANVARSKGIQIIEEFFGKTLALKLSSENKLADLIVANNVLAHVPDINDFVAGFSFILKPKGIATFEFPHLLNMVSENLFDTIYHEHYSYLSLIAVKRIFEKNGLSVFDVEEIPTHGGSLRVYAQRIDADSFNVSERVKAMLEREQAAGVNRIDFYKDFQINANRITNNFVDFLMQKHRLGKSVAGYGAAAKGNTLINYAGIRPHLLNYVVDRNPAKQGKYLPGSRIPIFDEDYLKEHQPDFVVILAWNLGAEIFNQLAYIREWGGNFVMAVPALKIYH